MTSTSAEAPPWFRMHTATPPASRQVMVDDAAVHYLDYQPANQTRDTLVFVHGGAANAQWWAPLAPFFVRDGHRVVCMDLSGMGLSDWREEYGVDQWARDVLAVTEAVSHSPVALIAHSLGGIVGAHAAVTHGSRFSRFIAVDSPVWNHAPAPETPVGDRADRPMRHYEDPEVPIGRFTLIPEQGIRNAWYIRHIAWHGLKLAEAGWTWRFDRHIFDGAKGENRIARFEGDLAQAHCPCVIIMGEDSYLTPSALERAVAPVVLIPQAQHHIMLDEPLALVAALRALLADHYIQPTV